MIAFSLLAFHLAESFSPENPWVRRVTGLPIPPRRGWRDAARSVAMVLLVALLPTLWLVALESEIDGMVGFVAAVSYTLAISAAFISPALGAAARERLDTDPLLSGAMLTRLTDRQALAAVHGRVLWWSALAFSVVATIAFFMVLMIYTDYVRAAPAMRYTLLHHFLTPIRFWGVLQANNRTLNAVATAAAVVMVLNYGAGCYLRATILAGVCQLNPAARWWGGLITAFLVFLNMFTLLIRVLVPYGLGRFVGTGLTEAFLVYAILEAGFLIARLILARSFWRRTVQRGLDDTRALLQIDPEAGQFVS